MKKKTPILKLYVWENVLTDYSDGIAFALAESPEAALRQLKETDETAFWSISGYPQEGEKGNPPLPKEFTTPVAFTCWGSS